MRFRSCALLIVILLLMGAAGSAGFEYWKQQNKPQFRTVETDRGKIVEVVNATGEVKPVLSVSVGSFVSGPIEKLSVDFNETVSKGQVLAEIDPRIYEASVAADKAGLASRQAEVQRVKADLEKALKDEKRSIRLSEEGGGFISEAEVDQAYYSRRSLEAQLKLAEAAVTQAEANLANSEANLEYTKIVSPVDGIVIDRLIDPGQTLAAQFQTPELFVIAPEMEKQMHVFASVDEADIGMIRAAQESGKPVHFTVDAYREDLFEGQIEEIRLRPTLQQNVVTYPVVVASPNPELKLMPGMTADLSFEISALEDVVRIPNAALRYFPDQEHVREQDRGLLDGSRYEDEYESEDRELSATEKNEATRRRNTRHVWVVEGDFLKAIEVEIGISDSRYSQLVSGELESGQKLVTGLKLKKD